MTAIDAAGRLIVHTRRDGVIEIPLSGDPRLDALLERFAARGGAVVGEDGALVVPDARPPAAAALQTSALAAQGELL
jgi:hypothetical protein